jgi:hypothetical protein
MTSLREAIQLTNSFDMELILQNKELYCHDFEIPAEIMLKPVTAITYNEYRECFVFTVSAHWRKEN